MEPITGIISVIQLTGALLSLTHGYMKEVASASEDIAKLQNYLQDFKQLLEVIKDLSQRNPELESLAVLTKQDGALRRCHTDLESLQSRLDCTDRGWLAKLIRFKRLTWPLKSDDVSKFIAQIEQYKSLFTFALSLDTLPSSAVGSGNRSVQGLKYENIAPPTEIEIEAILRQNLENIYSDDPLSWLHPGATNTKHLEISNARQPESGSWFLESPEFIEFVREKPEGSMIWAYGIPGAGKTYITSLVIDYLKDPTNNSYGVAYIYFDYKDFQQHKPTFVLASMVKQLVSQTQQVPPQIEALHETLKKEKRKASFEELYTALTYFPRAFLVFDALDECKPDHQKKLLQLFRRMKRDHFSVFLTSRPHSGDIRASLRDTLKVEVSAKIEDIRLYVQVRLDESPQAQDLFQNVQCNGIASDLLACTEGIFLLVHFYMNLLCQQPTEAAILATIGELGTQTSKQGPGPLESIYERAINTINSQIEPRKILARKVLWWLLNAGRTLTFDEIQVAVSIKPDRYELDNRELPSRTTILDVCAGLVTVDEHTKTVRLVHRTAQEYLLKEYPPPETANLDIAIACTTYLSFNAFAGGACTSNQDHLSRIESNPFLEYTARYLSFHLKACDETLSTDAFLRFLERPGSIDSFQQVSFLAEYPGYYYDRYPKNRTPLHVAASIGHETVTQLLLDKATDIWSLDSDRRTALHCAAREGHATIVKMLIEKGVGPSDMDKNMLYKTIKKGHLAITRLLTDVGAMDDKSLLHISAGDIDGKTALHWAAERGCEEAAKLLIEGGADMSIKDNYGRTTLHSAAGEGRDSLVRLLVEKGADISAKDRIGQTALRLAAGEGHEAVIRVLLANGADITAPDNGGQSSLHRAAYKEHSAVIRLLVNEKININFLDADGDPPLHNAILYGRLETVQLLIDLGANISIPNDDGRTALHWAAYGGSVSVTKLLLDMGATTSSKDKDGRTPLHLAAYKGHPSVARLLIARGADISALDNLGRTALHWAAYRGYHEIVQLLIDRGINVLIPDVDRDSAFHLAASKGHMPVIQLLIGYMTDISIKGSDGKTGLHWAASRGNEDVAKLFISRGIDKSVLDNNGKTALHWAADRAREGVVRLLVDERADMSILDHDGRTPLHWAAYRGNTEVVQLLIDGGANTYTLDGDGKIALLLAVENRRDAVAKLLVHSTQP